MKTLAKLAQESGVQIYYNTIAMQLIREKKGTMVLFTSYSMLNMAYNALKPHFDAERILLLAQGKSGTRTNIVMQFKDNIIGKHQ